MQVYLQDVVADRARPVKELRAFEKISLKPSESQVVTFFVFVKTMEYYDRYGKKVVDPGLFRIFVGGNSRDTLMAELIWDGPGQGA